MADELDPTVEYDVTSYDGNLQVTAQYTHICGEVDPGFTYQCGHSPLHDGDHSWEPGQPFGVSILMPRPPASMEDTKMEENPNKSNDTNVGWDGMLYHMEHLLGFRLNEEEETHLKVLLTALQKYHERDSQHRGLWRYFGAIDSAHQARAKATRTYNNAVTLLKHGEGELEIDPLDDAIDLINYSVFFMRNVQEGNYGG